MGLIWRLLVTEPLDGATNMALDEALLRGRVRGASGPTVRFYGWRPAAVSLGYAQPLDETVEVYSSRFRLTREVTLLDTPEARKALAGRSSVTVAGRLEYQACDDKVCYSPGKVPVSFVVSLK